MLTTQLPTDDDAISSFGFCVVKSLVCPQNGRVNVLVFRQDSRDAEA